MLEHNTVLLRQAVDALVSDTQGCYVDGTFGRGGHSRRILDSLAPQGRLLAIDKDPEAVALARRWAASEPRLLVRHASFAALADCVTELNWHGRVQGVLLDLGVSSHQLDDAERGFSFAKDGPLDMRMNPDAGISAADWLASAREEEIADVLRDYGEERFSRRIARAIVDARAEGPIERTLQLANIVKQANPAWERHKHPATRAFQAIRIFINNELDELRQVLTQAVDVLAPGGRLVVISFHSLEDRLVKRFIQAQEQGERLPRGLPVTAAEVAPRLKRQGKAIKVSAEEQRANQRARSAIMRVAEKPA